MGACAGAFAAAATTPLDVIKTNMMCTAASRPTMMSASRAVLAQGGPKYFFRYCCCHAFRFVMAFLRHQCACAMSEWVLMLCSEGVSALGQAVLLLCRGVGARALSNGINSAVFFCFFEALRATFAQKKQEVLSRHPSATCVFCMHFP